MKIKFVLFFLFVSTLSFAQIRVGVLAGANLMSQKFTPELKVVKVSNIFAWHAGILVSIPIVEGLSFQPGLNYQLKGGKGEFPYSENKPIPGVPADIIPGISMKVTVIGNSKVSTKCHYIELPLNFSYAFGTETFKITPYAGGYVSYAMSAKITTTNTPTEIKEVGLSGPALPTTLPTPTLPLPALPALSMFPETTVTEDIKFKEDDKEAHTARALDYGSQFGVGLELDKIFLRLQYSLGFADIDREAGQITTNNGLGLSIGYWITDGSSTGGNSNKGTSFKSKSKSKPKSKSRKSKYSHRRR